MSMRGDCEQATASKAMQHVVNNRGRADTEIALDLPL